MAIVLDYAAEIIRLTSPTVSEDLQVIHDFIEDSQASPVGMLHPYDNTEIILPEGKIADPSQPGIFSQIIVVLNPRWQFQFWGGSGYSQIKGGKLVGGLSDQPIKATGTANDITVLISPVDGVTVVTGGGGGPTASAIADAVWDEPAGDHLTAGSTGKELKKKLDSGLFLGS